MWCYTTFFFSCFVNIAGADFFNRAGTLTLWLTSCGVASKDSGNGVYLLIALFIRSHPHVSPGFAGGRCKSQFLFVSFRDGLLTVVWARVVWNVNLESGTIKARIRKCGGSAKSHKCHNETTGALFDRIKNVSPWVC